MKTTKTTKRLLVSLLALLAVFAIGMSAACFKKKPVDSSSGDSVAPDSSSSTVIVTPVTYEGKYYFEGDEGSFSLELKADSLYTLAAPDSEYSGKFTVTDGQFAFYVAETVAYTGTAQGENIQLMYGSNALLFLPDVNYTVTFDMGGSTQTQTVRNGKPAVKPEDPKKEGYLFVNWYVDAQFTSLYSFAKPVTQDTTVYARFFQEGDSEYSVKFFNGSEQVLDMVYTQGKKLASLPEYTQEGKEFLGWWTSDSRSPEKLTRQLTEGETLHEDTVLYAVFKDDEVPALSVTADGFSWSSMGKNVSYEIYVTAPSGKRELLRSGTFAKTEYEYDFAALEAGEYKVEVVVANTQKTAVAYVTNKMLSRPSGLRVDAFQFMFDPVAGAQKYLLSVNCASAGHNHKDYNLNLATSYDFSNCEMAQDGMTFTVTAVAEGYVSATSETFVLTRNLQAVTELSYDENTAVLTWQEAANAQEYLLELAVGGQTITERLEKTTYSLKGYTGDITVKVTPYAQGYALPEAASLAFNKKSIATPANFNYEYKDGKDYLTWDNIEGAAGYEITIEGTDRSYLTNANTTEFIFTEWVGLSVPYVFNVQALSKTSGANSLPAELTVKEKIEDIWYEDGMLYWDAVRGHSYTFRLNDEQPIDIGGLASYAPQFNKAGENTLSIGYYKNDDKSTMKWVETKVETFALIFDTRGGSKADIRYLANGDTVTVLDESQITYAGYDFQGWYDVPEGYLTNGKKYEGTFKFTATESTYIYASWSAKHFNITLDVMSGAPLENSVFDVYYRQNEYMLPVPDVGADTTKGFLGWYTDKNGQGMQYTDLDGANVAQFRNLGDITLYAFWADAFEFNELNDGTYSVKKGSDVNMFEVLTIPATYLGKSVSMVEGAGFKGIKSLVVKIPDTIKDIIILSTDVGSAFENASYLQAVEVYHVEGNNIPARYFSEDGILYFENETDVTEYNNTELKFIPAARKTPVYVSNKTEVIPMGAAGTIKSGSSSSFTHHFTEIHIPYTVTKVEKSAFEGNYYVENIYFEDAPGGVTAQPLTIGEAAFKGCSNLINLNLPGRVAEFDVNALENCYDLENVNISTAETNKELKSVDGVLLTADGTKLIYFPRGRAQSYTTPDTVTTIGSNAFSGSKITEIVISKFVRVIEPYAFSGVSDSSGKALSGELEGYYKGSSCTSLQSIVFQSNDTWTLEIGEGAFYGSSSGKLTEVTLPKNLVKLGKYAFAGRTALKTVNIEIDKNIIGYKKLELESGAFALDGASPSVVTLNIGDNVPEIANLSGIFGSADLKNINTGNNPNYKFADQVLYNGDNTKILYYLDSRSGAFAIPETVTEIGEATFRGKSGLTAITIHAGVTYVGDEAFKGCSNLESVLVRDGETEISFGDSVFENCSLLTDVQLSTRARVLGKNFFKGCKALTEITFPEGITEIGDGTFNSSSEYAYNSLKKVTFPATLEKFGEYSTKKVNGVAVEYLVSISAFVNCNKLEEIVVAEGNKNFTAQNGIFYSKDADGYYGLIICFTSIEGDVVIPAKTNKIWANAFKGNTAITSISFDGEVDDENYSLEIGSNAFYGCTNLKSFELPEGLQIISQNMFYGCTSLERVVVPSTVALIEDKAFNGCSNLNELVFTPTKAGKEPVELTVADGNYKSTSTSGPPVVTQSSPFGGCTSLKEVVFPERTVSIGSYVFYGLNVEKVTLPSTLTSLGVSAFQNTTNLEEVVFNTDSNGRTMLTTLPKEIFSGSGLKKITLPEGLVDIEYKAFYSCKNLESIVIPASVEVLGSVHPSDASYTIGYAFNTCSNLKSVTFAKGSVLNTIYKNSFGGTAITEISLPASIENIAESAFGSASSLTFIDFETYEAQLEDGTVKQVSSLKSIGYWAFQSTAIEHFVFPETLSNITLGRGLFASSSTLKTVTLSSTVADITKVFESINSNYVINPSEQADNYVVSADGNFLTNKAGTTIVLVVKQLAPEDGVLRIPDGVEVIETDAFGKQTGITKLIIPASVKTIKNGAFHHCTALNEIVFENDKNGVSLLENLGFTHDGSGGDGTVQGETYGVFQYCTALTKVTFPNSEYLTLLPYATFKSCTSLKEITLPEGLTQLSPIVNSKSTYDNDDCGVFNGCSALEKVVLPSTLEVIGGGTFYNCKKLKTVNLPEGLKTIDSCAFYCTSALTSITLPDSITELGHLSFMYAGLKTLDLNNVTKLGAQTFQNATALTKIDLSKIEEFTEPSTTSTSYGILYGCKALTTAVLPQNLTRLPCCFFTNCTKLTDVTNIEQVEDIGNNAFKSCTALTTIDISGAKTLGTEVFSGCTKLKTVKLCNTLEKLNNKDFYGCTVLATVEGIENVQTLGNYVFQNCKGLKTIDISKADTIDTNVFDGCAALTTVTICPTIKTLSNATFNGCTALTTVNNLDKIQKIGNTVFKGCTAMTKVDLSSATSLGTYVFQNCTKLKTVILGEGVKTLSNYAFQSCTALTDINLENVETFGQYVFNKCTSLVTVDLSSAKSLDIKLFLGCTKLANVTLGDDLIDLPQETFSGCKALKSITLPQGLQHIGSSAFYQCTGLTSIEIPAGVTKLLPKANSADSAYTSAMKLFYGCTSLTKVVFKGEVTVVGEQSFYGCTKLTEIIGADGTNDGFFASLKYIGKKAFYNTAIKSVKLSSLKAMGAQVFVKSKIEKVTIEGLEGVFDDMFADCTQLTEVNLSSDMLYIGNNAFDGCTSLASIELPNRIYSIGTEAFKGTALEHVRLPANLSELGAFAFDDTNLLYFDIYDYENFDVIDGVLYNKEGTVLVYYPCQKTELVDFTKLTGIAAYAFAGWGQEIDLVLAEGFVNIEEGTFSRSSIKSLTLPSTLETIGDKAFMDCANLTSVTFNQGLKSIGANAFSGTALTSVTLPDSLETIGESAFEDVVLTGTLTTGASLQSIGKKAFYGTKFDTVVLGDALLTIGESAFEGIEELTTVSGGAQLQEIGKKAFYGTNIQSFVFGDALVKIGDSAFESTPLTGEVTFGEAFDYLGSKAFKDTLITKVSLNRDLSSFGSYAFDGCANLTEAVFGKGLTSIGIYAFRNTKLTQVSFPETLTSIGKYAFAGTPLTGTLVIPKNVTSIGESAFEGAAPVEVTDEQGNTTLNYDGCSKIEEVVLPAGLETLENNYVFRNCYWLYKINLENITKLGKEVFAYCGTQNTDKVFSVTIGKVSLTSTTEPTIDKVATSKTYLQYTKNGSGPFAFSALKEITFTSVDYVTGKNGKLLIHADMLEKVTLPKGVKSLATYLFAYSGLKSVVIPASVEELSGATFNGCMNLESVVFEEGSKLKTIGYYSFMYCKNLKSLVLPNTVETINHNTFSYCISMNEIVIPLSCTKLVFSSFTGWTAEQTVKFRVPENMFTSVATDYDEDKYPVTRVFDYAD